MKHVLLVLAVTVITFSSCENSPKETTSTDLKIENIIINNEEDCDGQNCAAIAIKYPQITNAIFPTEKINEHIETTVAAIINATQEDQATMSLEQAIANFKDDFKTLRQDFPESNVGYEATVKGDIAYQSPEVLCVLLDSYMYTGGAHGYASRTFININAKTGDTIGVDALFKNKKEFLAKAETQFRQHENITTTTTLADAGYWFEGDTFHLPNNIGFEGNKMILLYNPYEIAAYSEGAIAIEIPLEDVQQYLNFK